MQNRAGKDVPIQWLCHDCHYPHHNASMSKCLNCQVPRDPAKEPRNFVRSKIRIEPPTVSVSPPPAKACASSSKAPSPAAPPPAKAAGAPASSGGAHPAADSIGQVASAPVGTSSVPNLATADDVDMGAQPEEEEPTPLFIPTVCTTVHTVRSLIRHGINAANKYKDHFQLKTVGPTDLQEQLATARRKLAGMEASIAAGNLCAEDFATELMIAKAEVTTLEDKLEATGDLDTITETAPGMETGLLSKLSSILSKHEKAMAAEETAHVDTVTSLEAQAAEIQQQLAEEHKMQTIRCAANEELLQDLRVKVELLKTAGPQSKAAEAKVEEAHAALQMQVADKFSQRWLEENGLHELPEPGVQVLLAQFTAVLQAISPAQQAAILTPTPTSTSTSLGEKKRLAGEMDDRWADSTEEAAKACRSA